MKEIITVPDTRFHKVIRLISLLLIIGMFLNIILFWRTIPNQIPGHYNGAGEVDRWGSKGELFLIPILTFLMFLGISVLEKHPSMWNTGVAITSRNKDRVYRYVKNMIAVLKLIMTGVFTYLSFCTVHLLPLYRHFTALSLIAVFGSMAYYLIRILRVPR